VNVLKVFFCLSQLYIYYYYAERFNNKRTSQPIRSNVQHNGSSQ
jgi:hypothetical protein